MAAFTITSKTTTTVTIRVTGITSGQTVRFYVRTDPETAKLVDLKYTATSTTMTKTFSGLSAGTDYACNVEINGTTWIGTQYFTTDSEQATVSQWSWTASNGSASAAQTKAAYTALTNKGETTDFSYLVWNDLVNKVKDVLDAKGYSWDSTYATYSATCMSYSDKTMTAKRFNSLRYNVGAHYSTGINEVSTGNIVYGWYFTTLASKINSWIG